MKDVLEPSAEAKSPSETDSKNEKDPKDSVHPVAEETTNIGFSDEKDLDPVALNKAFKFAAWSSVVLVCLLLLSLISQ